MNEARQSRKKLQMPLKGPCPPSCGYMTHARLLKRAQSDRKRVCKQDSNNSQDKQSAIVSREANTP